MKDNKCGKKVMSGFTSYVCGNKAKMESEGKYYCGVHDPVRIKARDDKKYKEYTEKWDARNAKQARADLCVSVLSDFSDSALSSGVVGEMVEVLKTIRNHCYVGKSKIPISPPYFLEVEDLTEVESILSKLEAK